LVLGGYVAKLAKWRQEEEERMLAGLPVLFEGMDEHSRNGCLARILTVVPDSKVTLEKPTTEQIYEKLEELAKMQKKGIFKPDR
jgi:hypothetical protein